MCAGLGPMAGRGPNPSIYMYYVYSPTQEAKRPACCPSNRHHGEKPNRRPSRRSRSLQTQRRGGHRRSADGGSSGPGSRPLAQAHWALAAVDTSLWSRGRNSGPSSSPVLALASCGRASVQEGSGLQVTTN